MKIGRNNLCPCGSGKKYKKCCGGTQNNSLPVYDAIKSESDFRGKIEIADRELAKKQTPIHARPFHAFDLLAVGYKGPLIGSRIDPEKYPNFVGPNLLKRITDWYKARYGERVCIPSDRGRVPVILREEIYLIRVPLVFGAPTIPILSFVEGLTQNMIKSFTEDERQEIRGAFEEGYELVYENQDLIDWLDSAGKLSVGQDALQLIHSAIQDRDTAVRCLAGKWQMGHLDTNSSCFHAQQYAEKMLKGFLVSKNKCTLDQLRRKPYGHNLKNILKKAAENSVIFSDLELDVDILSKFSMEIRYTDPKVSLKAAVEAFWASLRIGSLSACQISGMQRRYGFKSKYKIFKRSKEKMDFDTTLEAGKFYYNPDIGTSYFCERIDSNNATIFLVESDRSGSCIQVRFVQSTEYASQYFEITDMQEIERLMTIYRQVIKED
jgi:HEPN domain-containing protein